MNMKSIEELLTDARNSEVIKRLTTGHGDGAEGYLQAFAHMARSHPEKGNLALRRMAERYLKMTATQWEDPDYRAGAKIAREVVKGLQ